MTDNPYATPESDVEHHSGKVENGSIFWGSGRLSVASYFGQYFVLSMLSVVINLGITAMVTGTASVDITPLIGNPLIFAILAILSLIFGWVGFCQSIKRFHDRNLSGWWVLSLLILVGVIVLFIPGKEEPNRFGAWRQTRTWEKILVGTGLLAMLGFVVLTAYFAITSVE